MNMHCRQPSKKCIHKTGHCEKFVDIGQQVEYKVYIAINIHL